MSNLKPVDRMFLEKLLAMAGGYVLSFSNATFEDFIRGSTGEEVYSERYSGNGDSKANRLRAFWNVAPDSMVATLLEDLLTLMIDNEKVDPRAAEAERVREIVQRLRAGDLGLGGKPAGAGQGGAPAAFVSYSVDNKIFGGVVKECLAGHGYSCFLAHEDLQVSEEWKHRILEELGRADVFVALLSKDFMKSKWCDQEVGFILSRPGVLVVPLSIDGTTPYGFIDHLQGIRVDDQKTVASVLEGVLYRKRPRHMIPPQIEKMRHAKSFRRAEAEVQPLVPYFEIFTVDEVNAFAQAASGNGEVWDATLCRTEYIPRFVRVNGARMSPTAAAGLKAVLPELVFS